MAERLSADTWIEFGLRVLATEGLEAVRVEPLAHALGVTKGSFYWHFADRAALLESLLAEWEQLATITVIEVVNQAANEPADRLRELTRLVFREGGPLDRAVRAWASHDEEAARVVARVDVRRYGFVRELLEAHGFPRDVAAMRARMLYTSLIGEQHTSLRLSRKRRVECALANLELLLTPVPG